MEFLENLVYERIRQDPFTPFVQEKCFDPSIFNWEDVNTVFNNSQILKNCELIDLNQGKIPLTKFFYKWQGDIVDKDQLFYSALNGFTIVVINLSTYNKKIQEVCRNLENIFNGASDVHAYFSLTSTSKSFGIHNDRPHNLIIQTEGECDWKVWNTTNKEETNNTPVLMTTLKPGDIIYVPSELYHQCIPKGKRVSISIPTVPEKRAPRKYYDFKTQTVNM